MVRGETVKRIYIHTRIPDGLLTQLDDLVPSKFNTRTAAVCEAIRLLIEKEAS
jgi:metal-responsive CopG/Arc/MetJ family transcriptional regulator